MSKNKGRKHRSTPPVTRAAPVRELNPTRRYSVRVGTWLALAFGAGSLIMSATAMLVYSSNPTPALVWVFAPIPPFLTATIVLYVWSQRPVYEHSSDAVVFNGKGVSASSAHSSGHPSHDRPTRIEVWTEKVPTGPTPTISS